MGVREGDLFILGHDPCRVDKGVDGGLGNLVKHGENPLELRLLRRYQALRHVRAFARDKKRASEGPRVPIGCWSSAHQNARASNLPEVAPPAHSTTTLSTLSTLNPTPPRARSRTTFPVRLFLSFASSMAPSPPAVWQGAMRPCRHALHNNIPTLSCACVLPATRRRTSRDHTHAPTPRVRNILRSCAPARHIGHRQQAGSQMPSAAREKYCIKLICLMELKLRRPDPFCAVFCGCRRRAPCR